MNKPKEGSDYFAESDEELLYEGEEELEDDEPSKPVMKPSQPLALGNNNRDPIEPKPKVPPYQPNSNTNLAGKPSLTSPAPKPTEGREASCGRAVAIGGQGEETDSRGVRST
jgi:hypothetical protein